MSSQLGPGKIDIGLLRWADRMPEVELWCPSVADTVCQLEWRFFPCIQPPCVRRVRLSYSELSTFLNDTE